MAGSRFLGVYLQEMLWIFERNAVIAVKKIIHLYLTPDRSVSGKKRKIT